MDAEPSNSPVQIGDIVAGKYRIERSIGRGGIGVVVAAHHLALDEPVALKFIGVNLASEREVVQRLLREARATFRLRSKHTVRVLDADELPSGAVYIVMELLDGKDLRAELDARGPLPEAEVVTHVLQACDALEEAHTLGIVHRDLKPHNLFLAKQRSGPSIVKVLDFGMSKIDPAFFEAGPLTLPETALGTPRYMAPEQWRSASTVDHRADIWALGVVMYELATGKVPLQGMPLAERQARMLAGAIPSPRDVRPDVSEAMARVIGRCLKADPKGRWPSVAHLATALRDAHPSLRGKIARADVTMSDVTAVVPTQDMAEQAARAFAGVASAPEPEIERAPQTDRNEFDANEVTVVRAPAFEQAELTLDALPSPAIEPVVEVEKKAEEPRPNLAAGTLRSAGGLPEIEALLRAPTADETLRLPGAPPHPLHLSKDAPVLAPPPLRAPPPGAMATVRSHTSQPRRGSLVAVAIGVAIAAMSAGALAAWFLSR